MSGTQAATNQANLSVTATVAANCTISTTAVAFGAYDPVGANLASALDNVAAPGKVTVNCTTGSAATVQLGQGGHADAGSTDAVPDRRMSDGAGTPHFLDYALYSNAGLSTIWGNDATVDVAYTGTGASADLNVYGVVAANQQAPVGSYTDTVIALITF
jgi:spore coat protein U-like protein